MSYEIMYDRKFIRTTRGIIPMILSGSNNCTEVNWDSRGRTYERRVRYWWPWIPRTLETKDLPEEDYLEAISQICQDKDNDYELFKWNGQWLTYRQWRRWFQNGCKAAMSIEEYLRENPVQSFNCFVKVYPDKTEYSHSEELRSFIRTTAELEAWLDRANARKAELYKELNNTCDVYICLEFSHNEPLKMPSKTIEGSVVAKNGHSYVKSYVKDRQLTFTGDPLEAAVFASVDEAKTAIGTCWNKVRFVQAQRQMRSKDYVLKIHHGHLQDKYISRRTKNCLFVTWSSAYAKRFPTQSDATRYAADTCRRFNIGDSILVENLAENTQEEVRLREGAA